MVRTETVQEKIERLQGDYTSNSSESQEVRRKKVGNLTSKNIALLLYPDCDGHVQAFAKVLKKWDYTYILHDKDTFEDEEDMHGGEENIDLLKKPHYHVLLHFPFVKSVNQVAKELMIEQRFVQRISDRNAMLCYLVHTGLHDKYQYSREEVHSNRPSLFLEAMAGIDTKTETLLKVISIIQNKNFI